MTRITVHTQMELDAALAAAVEHQTEIVIESPAAEWLKVQTTQNIHVEARGSSHVVAWESSHVEARGT